ncbi:TIGR02688 family protein [Mycobacterium kyorinense]|uniref:non-specific serine/threonine protein kinase n=1 Tax=Mycobacterium kyorinense TaxID=487514 RepID=A0A1A2Z074_9MYCO|nr:BREX system Lon protease-like protein BrxL [Mycobacterium kyorinense]OBI43924.1 TIGR02688 family protein [Mycobacterium kyorinense]
MIGLDDLDTAAAEAFDGYLVKKDLAQQFRGQYPVPTYVGEFLLGRYCATTDPDEIAAGLEMVQRSMRERTVRAGEEELFKHRARDKGRVKIIDLLRARLDARSDAYKAELPSLQLNDIHISAELVNEHQRMLTGGFYAEVTLEYIAALAQQQGGQPFRVEAIRPIQMSTHDALGEFVSGRKHFTLDQWRSLLLRSVGFAPERFTVRQQDILLLRMVPFVVNNYNAVELGPRGTGKSHLFQQISPYAHLVSGGKATIANMFVNMSTGRRGLVAQYDVICFDEVSGVSFDQKEGVNILKGYMESGEFSRGKESIRADGGIVMVGNFDVDVSHQLRTGHLLGPLPKEMRDDTAFMDRIHAYIPGWDVPKLNPSYFTDHFGFVSDFLAEVWSRLRRAPRLDAIQGRLDWGNQLSGRDRKAANHTVDGLLRLLYPDPEMEVPAEFLAWAATLALESRRRVKEAQAFIGADEFGHTDLSFSIGGGSEVIVYCDESLMHRAQLDRESRDGQTGGGATSSGLLPAPEPGEVTSSVQARDYAIGDTIGGRFEVDALLGSGGFSKVYRVRDVVEGEQRALKLFDSAAGYDAVRREVGALRKVDHPNVVKVIWADRTDHGEWYLIMEYVDGESLADYVDGSRHLRDREAVDVALDVLDALAAFHPDTERIEVLNHKKSEGEISAEEYDELMSLHEKALVHRDIKPQNIMLTRAGAKLLDFNIASRVGDPVKTVSGTPPYQPPDADLTRWDVSTDLFAVGVTLYELLCDGQHPYPHARPTLDADPRDPRQFRGDLAAGLAEFLEKACARDRKNRFQTAAEMRAALVALRSTL